MGRGAAAWSVIKYKQDFWIRRPNCCSVGFEVFFSETSLSCPFPEKIHIFTTFQKIQLRR